MAQTANRQSSAAQDFFKKYWLSACIAIATGVGGFLLSDVLALRDNNRELLKEEYLEVKQTYIEVNEALQVFIDQARGEDVAGETDIVELRASLLKLQSEINDVALREPTTKAAAKGYEGAMINLLDVVADFHDAYDGGGAFVMALAEFKQSQEKFERAVVDRQEALF